MPRPYRTTLTPEQLSERARNAAQARTTLDAHIDAVVAKALPLTEAQKAKLRPLLAPAEAV